MTGDRMTRARVVELVANCEDCSWRADERNALGNAARHHDASGHVVVVEQTISVVYGDVDQARRDSGQTTLEDAIAEAEAGTVGE